MKLDVAEGLSGALDGQLVLGGAVGVVERRLGGAALGDASQILDGQRGVEAALGAVELGSFELDQRRQVVDLGHSSFDRHVCHRSHMESASDPFDLKRFVDAQAPVYRSVVEELRDGRKRSHWMWFVFPQLLGLGSSPMAVRYGISSLDEARAYLTA